MQIQNINQFFSNTDRAHARVSTYYFHVLLVLLVRAGVRRGLTAGERTNAQAASCARTRADNSKGENPMTTTTRIEALSVKEKIEAGGPICPRPSDDPR
jgi:hypothetical protein